MRTPVHPGTAQDWLVVDDLWRAFDGRAALRGTSLALREGEIGVLLGPSGCGKTTALRCIAGFERPDRGRILARGRVLRDESTCIEPHERRIGFVFQEGALFPHLNVRGNVEFGLHGMTAAEKRARSSELLEALDLAPHAGQYPAQLSGGQQQRVALARALAPRPDTILLDEPFSSLDAGLRERLASELRGWLRTFGVTALVVTHDLNEALGLADRIGVMHQGRVEQWADPYELYHRPATPFVASFVGKGVLLAARSEPTGRLATELGAVDCSHAAGSPNCELLLRPDDLVLDDLGPIRARVVDRAFRGAEYLYTLELQSGHRVFAFGASHHARDVGAEVRLRLEPHHVVVFEALDSRSPG